MTWFACDQLFVLWWRYFRAHGHKCSTYTQGNTVPVQERLLCDPMLSFPVDNLLFVINSIKQEIVNRVQSPKDDRGNNMEQKLDVLIKDTLGKE